MMNLLEAICHGEAWPQSGGAWCERDGGGNVIAVCVIGGAKLAIGRDPDTNGMYGLWPILNTCTTCPKCEKAEEMDLGYIIACHLGMKQAHYCTTPCIIAPDGDGRYTRRQTVEWLLTLPQFEGYENPYEVVTASVTQESDAEVEVLV